MTAPQGRDFPLWLLVLGGALAWAFWQAVTSDIHAQILATLWKGLGITLLVTVTGFAGASALGLVLALGSLSRVWLIRQIVRLYVEVMRGIPIIVLLLYVAFVLAPLVVAGWNAVAEPLGLGEIRTRDFPLLWRAVIALTMIATLLVVAFVAVRFAYAGRASKEVGK